MQSLFLSIIVAANPGLLWESAGSAPDTITGLQDQILAALEPIRPISTFPTLVQADSVEVAVRAQLVLDQDADSGTVIAAALVALNAYIGSLRLGGAVLYSQVLRTLAELPGVTDVENLRLRRAPLATVRSPLAHPPRSAIRGTSPPSRHPAAATSP